MCNNSASWNVARHARTRLVRSNVTCIYCVGHEPMMRRKPVFEQLRDVIFCLEKIRVERLVHRCEHMIHSSLHWGNTFDLSFGLNEVSHIFSPDEPVTTRGFSRRIIGAHEWIKCREMVKWCANDRLCSSPTRTSSTFRDNGYSHRRNPNAACPVNF